MTAEEVQALRTAARTWEATPVTANKPVRREIADSIDVMLGTGVRTGELLGSVGPTFDPDADLPTVSVMGTVTRGADGEGMIYQPAPKSETSKRILYLPAIAVDALRRQFDDREFRAESGGDLSIRDWNVAGSVELPCTFPSGTEDREARLGESEDDSQDGGDGDL